MEFPFQMRIIFETSTRDPSLGSDKFIDFLAGLKLALDSVGSLLSSVLQMYITQFLQYSVSVCVFWQS